MISTFICCHNHGKYLEEAIHSVLSQEHLSDFILIDDGSTDNTWKVMEKFKFKDERIRALRTDIQQGNIASYNHAILLCKQPFIHLMAADDVLNCNTIYARCMKELEDPTVGFCSVGLKHIDEEGSATGAEAIAPFSGKVHRGVVLQALGQLGNFINGGCTIVRKSAQTGAGPYDAGLPFSADFANWVRILGNGWDGAFIAKPWYSYRQHRKQMTHKAKAPVEERQAVAEELARALNGVY